MNESIVSDSMAYAKLNDVDVLAAKLGAAESLLEEGYAQFASVLLDVQENLYWQLLDIDGAPCPSWGAYIAHIVEKFHMGKAQLYHKIAVCRQLKGVVAEKDLTDMGISKASVLADVHRATGKVTAEAVAAAKRDGVTVKDLKTALAQESHLPEQESGEWLDLNMAFYVNAEEKATIQDAITAARQMDPPVSNTIKDFQQRKEIMIRLASEFLSTYAVSEDEAPF